MRFLDDYDENILKEDKLETWFNINGKEISNENESFFAKIVEKKGSMSYYVRTHDGYLLDPVGMYGNRSGLSVVMKRVSKTTFDFYMMYLNTKNNLYLTRAERGYLNE